VLVGELDRVEDGVGLSVFFDPTLSAVLEVGATVLDPVVLGELVDEGAAKGLLVAQQEQGLLGIGGVVLADAGPLQTTLEGGLGRLPQGIEVGTVSGGDGVASGSVLYRR
jgi:hypothetical protein